MRESTQTFHRSRVRLWHNALAATLVWTALIAASLVWSLSKERADVLNKARHDAQLSFQKELLFRFWTDNHGGSAPAAKNAPLSPDIVRAEERGLADLAPMLRQMQGQRLLDPDSAGIRSHLASLNPLQPENTPDAWEAVTLQAFAKGETEVASIATVDGQEYMRVMRPLVNEASCLPCHGAQDYKIGDIRGGLSVSVPMAPLKAAARSELAPLGITDGFIWVLGLGVIGFVTRRMQAQNWERAMAEMVLQDSETRHRAVVNSANDAFVTINTAGKITGWDGAAEKIFHYTAAEMLGQPLVRILPPAGHDHFFADFKRIQAGGALLRLGKVVEIAGQRSDGSVFPLELSVAEWQISGERFFTGTMRDITERKRAEEVLRESEQRFRILFEQANDGMLLADVETKRFTLANRQIQQMLGYSEEELFQLTVADIHPAADLPAVLKQFEKQARGEITLAHALPMRRKDGTVFYADINTTTVRLQQHNCLLGTFRDITERKQAEAALRASEERHRLLFENNPLPMLVYDVETLRFLAVNESAVQNYGYTREEFLGMTIKQIRPPEDIPALLKAIAEVGAESRGPVAARHRRKDGTVIHVELVSRPLVFDGRRAKLVLASDVTEKKLLQEQFLHAQRLESIGMLASGIAHDLNNVLAPIVFAAPLLRGSLSAPRDLKILDTMERSAARGTGLVQQILGFAHTAAGELQTTQVKHLTRDIIGVIEETFPKSIQLEHRVPSDLWLVQGNATQIHQVLMNLCVNARDAMPSGGTLRLTAANRRLGAAECGAITGARPGDWLMLEVTDTGTGITPEVLQRIWEPFFTTKSAGKGTGLGLSTVRGIVASHHGFIELLTEVGHGTTFRVYLPAVTSAASQPGRVAPVVIPDGHGELILVVDDETPIRDLATHILGQHGYRVVTCVDGLEAVSFLFSARASEIALVITDVDMPHLGGVALARAALQLRPDIRILAMSGLSRNDTGGTDVPEIRKLAHGFLPKPFKPEELLGAIHRLLHPPIKT